MADITKKILDDAYKVHSALGPGLLESAYEACLVHELKKDFNEVRSQVGLPIIYDGLNIDVGYRLDIVVDNKVLIELKSVENVLNIHKAQILSYMKLSKIKVGLLINFNVVHLRDGIFRFANGIKDGETLQNRSNVR
jgi:GxxExxY protein